MHAEDAFRVDYDSELGGFGHAPKFPMPVNLNFLLRNGNAESRGMALATLRAMSRGGIHDQLGGGFHRYSTDERWHVPHFEKMLYDNAQIAVNYIEAFQITGDTDYAQTARDTLDYMLRDLSHADGGYYSAEDADSVPHDAPGAQKSEGAFYLWSEKELTALVGRERAEMFSYMYGVKENGNAASDPQGEFTGKNILFQAHTLDETAQKFKKSPSEEQKILTEIRATLFDTRARRPRPHLDDKIITAWNGLAISAFARACAVFGEQKYLDSAVRAAQFVREKLYDVKTRQLYRRWRDNERKVFAIADDYAFLAQGLLDLYESSFDPQWLEWAIELTDAGLDRFFDDDNGGFFMTEKTAGTELLFRVKEDSDNVEPCASSVFTRNLLRLGQFTGSEKYSSAADRTLRHYAPQMKTAPRALPEMISALSYALGEKSEIVVVGDSNADDTRQMLREIQSRFIADKVIVLLDTPSTVERMSKIQPFFKNFAGSKDRAAVYICKNFTCGLPVTDIQTLRAQFSIPPP